MYRHKCNISVLFVCSYFVYINAGRYLLLRPPTETTHHFLATKAHFSADTLRRDLQAKAHVPRAAGIDFARVEGGFHVLCHSCSRQAFVGKGLSLVWSVVIIDCPLDGKRTRVHSQQQIYEILLYHISLPWRKNQYVTPGCRYPRTRHDTITQKTAIRFFFHVYWRRKYVDAQEMYVFTARFRKC